MSPPDPHSPLFQQRRAGVLLHPSSLPGPGELGGLGPDALRFIDFLAAAGFGVWQVLPLGPTHDDLSPYMSFSVHAGNPRLISLPALCTQGWLYPDDLSRQRPRQDLLEQARRRFEAAAPAEGRAAYQAFLVAHQSWLDDYACYQGLRQLHGGREWTAWPAPYRDREPHALACFRAEHADLFAQVCFEQFLFFGQWSAVKQYAHERNILLFGDMPIFVAHDSAEVWAHREYFDLDAQGQPRSVAGVPPDYFSETGQYWGNPHYRWDVMAADGYLWWRRRMASALELYDLVRLDHFRGFEAYWEIPAGAQRPSEGRWVAGPGGALFDALYAQFPQLPLVAEDLGIITPAVEALRDEYRLPGMKILQFAFDGSPDNPYLPHRHLRNAVVYTGTHDNDTTVGWYTSLDERTQQYVDDRLSGYAEREMPWRLIEAALASPAMLAVIPMQDLLGLGSEARMNTPGKIGNNWRWRFDWEQLPAGLAARLLHLLRKYTRLAPVESS